MVESAQPTRIGRGRRGWALAPLAAGWSVAGGCFGFVYWRVHRAAASRDQSVPAYLDGSLDDVRWGPWLALMVAYCAAYTLLDSLVVTRVVGWSLRPTRYRELMPVRAAASVLALVNDQLGKAAVALVLRRRHGVPIGAAASSMVFLMLAEYLSLCLWASAGFAVGWERLPPVFDAVPWVAAVSLVAVAAGHGVVTRAAWARDLAGRRPLLGAFGRATAGRYLEVIGLRAPAMALAIGVYTLSIGWFGVPVGVREMAGVLPVILLGAAVPGPMRAVAVTLWVVLFPDHPAQMAAFGLLQHLAFVVINALLGLAFLPIAARALTGRAPAAAPAGSSTRLS